MLKKQNYGIEERKKEKKNNGFYDAKLWDTILSKHT